MLLKVDAQYSGDRLDHFLALRLPDTSRTRLQSLVKEGAVLLDGHPARASVRLHRDQTVSVRFPAPRPAAPEPEDLPLVILYQDSDLAVVHKPAGMIVHPGAGAFSGTLVGALLFHLRDLSGIGGVLRPGIVHRLDRGTSGLLVVAKTDSAHSALARQFADRTVHKEYVAIVHGQPRPAQGHIRLPVSRHRTQRHKMTTESSRGRTAHTEYVVEETLDGGSLVRLRIHTGRTHQIRVHLAALGHPVVGDTTYGGRRTPSSRSSDAREALATFPRPALHAARLGLTHPSSGVALMFEAPLTEDLTTLLGKLRSV